MNRKYPEVLITPESTSTEQLANFMYGDGSLPDGSVTMKFDEFKKIGRVDDCDCGLIRCVCQEARQHKDGCPYKLAMTCAVPISCDEHDLDICPDCHKCTCQ